MSAWPSVTLGEICEFRYGKSLSAAQLRQVYEAVWGTELDPRNFHRKVTKAEGFLTPTGETIQRGRGRPAELFRPGPAMLLLPPLLRGD